MLSAMLFPAVVNAKVAAKKAVCASNFKQAAMACDLYTNDYDDLFPVINQHPGAVQDPRNDRTWVQLLLPYTKSLSIFEEPADGSVRIKSEGSFDQDLVPDDTYARFYESTLKSNIGFNYMYLSPAVNIKDEWVPQPKASSSVADPTRTLMFVDSVYGRDSNGKPYGGGSYLVVPPCRFALVNGQKVDSFSGAPGEKSFYAPQGGWDGNPDSKWLYGAAWPWHAGRMNVAKVDGSVKSMSPQELSAGCDAQPDWKGFISNSSNYIWDSR